MKLGEKLLKTKARLKLLELKTLYLLRCYKYERNRNANIYNFKTQYGAIK